MTTANLIGAVPVVGVQERDTHDQDNGPGNTIDGKLGTRWSAEGDGEWIQWDLGSVHDVSRVRIAFHKGDTRRTAFDLEVSTDGQAFTSAARGRRSSGTTTGLEDFDFTPVSGRFVRYVGHGNTQNDWNSVTEVEIRGTVSPPVEAKKGPVDDGSAAPHIAGAATVKPYPTIDSLRTSSIYHVFAGAPEQEIWTEEFSRTRTIHVANFAATGPVPIRITVDKPVTAVRVGPAHRGPTPTHDGTTVRFTLDADGPRRLVVFVTTSDGRCDPLYLMVDQPEAGTPDPGRFTHHFPAGTTKLDHTLVLGPGDAVYLAPGALVIGRITADHAAGITISGRGILQEPDVPGHLQGQSEGADFLTIMMDTCPNVRVEGITIRDIPKGWTSRYKNCDHLVISGVKIFSMKVNGDGIDPDGCRDVTIENCFVSTGDDAIVIKSTGGEAVSGVTVRGCVVETYPSTGAGEGGDGLKIGTETFCEEMSGIHFQDCDVVRSYGGNTISIIHRQNANIHDVTFEDIRVDADVAHAIPNFAIVMRDGGGGSVTGVTLRNVTWAATNDVVLQGTGISGVTFDHCLVAGAPLGHVQVSGGAKPPRIVP